MQRYLFAVLTFLLLNSLVNAQFVFEPFEVHPDSTYFSVYDKPNSDTSQINLSLETSIVEEGNSALRYDYIVQRSETWGGFARYQMWNPGEEDVWNFAPFQNMSLWYYNDVASTDSGELHLRISFMDVSDVPLNTTTVSGA